MKSIDPRTESRSYHLQKRRDRETKPSQKQKQGHELNDDEHEQLIFYSRLMVLFLNKRSPLLRSKTGFQVVVLYTDRAIESKEKKHRFNE